MRTSRRLVMAAVVAVLLLGGRPVAADEEAGTSICRGEYAGGEAECTLTYVGPVTVIGAYGTAIVTLEAVDPATGLRRVLDHCVTDGGGCVSGHRTTGLDVPLGTTLYCHVRGVVLDPATVVNRPGSGATAGSDEGRQRPKYACGTFTAEYADSRPDNIVI